MYEAELFLPPEGEPRADPAPNLLGNKGLKELVLGGMCLFDMKNVRGTSIPLVVIAQSGGGKSTFFEGVKEAFGDDADIYPVDAITPGQAKGMTKGSGKNKEVIRAELAPISMFDELNKWQMNYLEGVVIPVFGAEQGVKWRDGEKFDTSEWKCFPIATLLPYWQDFEGSGASANKKIHNIEQIMRRSLLMRLEDMSDLDGADFLDGFIDKVSSGLFENITYSNDTALDNYERLTDVISQAHQLPPSRFNGKTEYQRMKVGIKMLAPKIKFSKRVVYDRAFIANTLKMATGVARRYGRHVVTVDDVFFVMNILEANAKALGIYQWTCGKCGGLVEQDERKCPKCKEKLKVDSEKAAGNDS